MDPLIIHATWYRYVVFIFKLEIVILCAIHRVPSAPDQKFPIPYLTYHKDEKSVLKVISCDVELTKEFDTLLVTGTLIRVIEAVPVLPALSAASIGITLLPPFKETDLFQDPVPLAIMPFTLMEAMSLVSVLVHTRATHVPLIN